MEVCALLKCRQDDLYVLFISICTWYFKVIKANASVVANCWKLEFEMWDPALPSTSANYIYYLNVCIFLCKCYPRYCSVGLTSCLRIAWLAEFVIPKSPRTLKPCSRLTGQDTALEINKYIINHAEEFKTWTIYIFELF